MRRKNFLIIMLGIIFIFCSSAVYAQRMGGGMMGGGAMGQGYGQGPGANYGGWNQMSPDQQREWAQMRTKFWKDTLSLRQKLANKQMELHVLWGEDNPDPDKAKDLSDEISDLQAQLFKKRNEFLIQCRDKFGDRGWSCPGGGYGMGPNMMYGQYGMGPGMMGYGYGMGPGMMGYGYGMSPGMMGGMMGYGYGMGPGMMGKGYGMGPQYGPGYQGPQYQRPKTPMEEKDAKKLLENYLESTRNPNLKLGKLEDKGDDFEAEIVTKKGSLIDRIKIDKRTGWMRSVY
jgi:Spy/CpxP family protein refolding chaperone